jgi:uncharacterized protein (TIGR02145 family)
MVPANGDSLTVKLYASYKPNGSNEIKYAWLEIRVEDGTCICPAKTGANTSLNFMCHNLGGLDIISSSQLITYEHHGNWYRFGAKAPSVVNEGTNNGAPQGWTYNVTGATPPYYAEVTGYTQNNSSWDWPDALAGYAEIIANPCPAGWRLPTRGEWEDVIAFNNSPVNVPDPWEPDNEDHQTVFCNLKKFGDDLILPSAGIRGEALGQIGYRGVRSFYWSSPGDINNRAYYLYFEHGNLRSINANRGCGLSVRCVEAE